MKKIEDMTDKELSDFEQSHRLKYFKFSRDADFHRNIIHEISAERANRFLSKLRKKNNGPKS